MRKQLVLVAFLAVGLAVVAGLVAPSGAAPPAVAEPDRRHLRRAVDARQPDLGLRPVQAARRRGAPRQPLLGRPERRRAQEAPGERASTRTTRPTTGRCTTRWSSSAADEQDQARLLDPLDAFVGRPGEEHAAPRRTIDLRNFAFAAAKRYSGSFHPTPNGPPLPAVRLWVAWNEPNNPVFLKPQFTKISRHKYRLASPRIYAGMCNAIMSGVHLTGLAGEKVACGVTAPRGNNTGTQPRAVGLAAHLPARPQAGPRALRRLRAPPVLPASERVARASRRRARARSRSGTSTSCSASSRGSTATSTSGSPSTATRRIRPTETSASPGSKQASYLSQAYGIARANPRIDMMIWFLVKDEARIGNGWQSGLYTATGRRKPSWQAFRRMPK